MNRKIIKFIISDNFTDKNKILEFDSNKFDIENVLIYKNYIDCSINLKTTDKSDLNLKFNNQNDVAELFKYVINS